jgi:uncharacterized coiled-coil protein SlyX
MDLCEQAAVEKDPKKLLELVEKIDRPLEIGKNICRTCPPRAESMGNRQCDRRFSEAIALRKIRYGNRERAVAACLMASRRLEDRIRELCSKVVGVRDEELEPAIAELNAALREHNQRLRKLAGAKLTRLDPPRRRPSA